MSAEEELGLWFQGLLSKGLNNGDDEEKGRTVMAVTKQSKFGGRPVTREAPEPGTRVHLNLGIPQPLKAKIKKAAKTNGWSISAETAHRLNSTFEHGPYDITALTVQVMELAAQVRDLVKIIEEKESK